VPVERDDLGDRSAVSNQEDLAALTLQVGKAKRPHYPPAGEDNGGSLAGALQDLTGWRDAAEILRDLDPLLAAQPTADGPQAGSPARGELLSLRGSPIAGDGSNGDAFWDVSVFIRRSGSWGMCCRTSRGHFWCALGGLGRCSSGHLWEDLAAKVPVVDVEGGGEQAHRRGHRFDGDGHGEDSGVSDVACRGLYQHRTCTQGGLQLPAESLTVAGQRTLKGCLESGGHVDAWTQSIAAA
jgi:hypothetical protein